MTPPLSSVPRRLQSQAGGADPEPPLPAAPGQGTSSGSPDRSPSSASKPRVLVVDDDDPIRKLMVKIAERAGFDTETARDGGEAIHKLAAAGAAGFDLILLDLMMPHINGFDFLDHLKRHQPELVQSVVILTASPRIDEERMARETIRDIIHKPFDVDRLSEYLKTAAAEWLTRKSSPTL